MATFDHFGVSWEAVITRSLTFEQRQIEGQSWWQNWPIVCALKLCCWVEDLKMNGLGCRLANMKCRNSWQEPENGQNGHFSFFNGSGVFFCPILLIFSPNGLVWPTKQLWRGVIWFFWLHLFINTPYFYLFNCSFRLCHGGIWSWLHSHQQLPHVLPAFFNKIGFFVG